MRTKYKVYKKFSLHHSLPCRLDLVVQRVNTISAGAARDGNNDNCLYIYFHPPFVTRSGPTYWLQETWGLMKQKYGRERSLEKYLYNIIFFLHMTSLTEMKVIIVRRYVLLANGLGYRRYINRRPSKQTPQFNG